MQEERTITTFGRVPAGRLWWSAIFGGTFFALGVAVILGLFGLAVGTAVAGTHGVTGAVKIWSGIWSLVTIFVGFFAGGWLAARASGSQARSDGRLHGLVVWALGTVSLTYALLTVTRMSGLLSSIIGNARAANVPTGSLESMTVTAATWMLIATICGLIGGVLGGHAGGYREVTTTADIRRAA